MPASHPRPPPESLAPACPTDALAALDGEAFVTGAYQRLLGRDPTADERAAYVTGTNISVNGGMFISF